MIELRDIQHCFPEGEWELKIAALNLSSGEVLSIIGPNGSGKTTLLRIAGGLLKPLQGKIKLDNQNIERLDRRTIAKKLGFLPQELNSEYDLTVEELAGMGRYPHVKGWGRLMEKDRTAINNGLDLTGMAILRKRRLSQLSGGEKKRAFLASVLVQQPRFLLLDEPTAALDLPHQIRFFRLLYRLSREGLGIAVVTHDVNLASLYSDRLLLLSAGQDLALGPPQEVLTPEHVESIYGTDVILEKHPENNRPLLTARSIAEKTE